MHIDRDLPQRDLQEILAATAPFWDEARGESIFVTGGTGFFGRWLLESFAYLNASLSLDARLVVLTRDAESFRRKAPSLAANAAISFVEGDVRSFNRETVQEQLGAAAPPRFRFVVHAATAVSGAGAYDSLKAVETIVDGTRAALAFALASGTERFLFTSSGAVYGPQPADVHHITEAHNIAPDPMLPASAYGEAKRLGEVLCACAHHEHHLVTTVARCFAFVGPHLPLDAQFAVGNFLRDALDNRAIAISGDGTAQRSYLYASDLAIALWTILFRGAPARAYNVGSEEAVSLRNVAAKIAASQQPPLPVNVARSPIRGAPVQRYIPSIARLERELGFTQRVQLDEAIARTLAWHRSQAEDFRKSAGNP